MDSNLTSKCIYTLAWPEVSTKVVIPKIGVGDPMAWCQRNCIGDFDAMLEQVRGTRVWLFEYEEDATAFSLVWK
jgi:hypothetical protein